MLAAARIAAIVKLEQLTYRGLQVRRRHLFRLVVASLALALFSAPMARAMVTSSPTLVPGYGQTQAYDVLLRGNGEAVVNVRLTVPNNDATPLQQLHYEISGGSLSEITAFQEIDQVYCQSGGGVIVPIDNNVISPNSSANCAQLNTAGLYYYPYTRQTYQKAAVTTVGQSLTIALPSSVGNDASATVVLAYVASGYVKQHLGSYNFSFQTLKGDSRINSTSVAVSVDEGYQLAHANSHVNYRPTSTANDLSGTLANAANLSAEASASVASYVQGIGTQGQIVKNASQLAPHESLTVKGIYASSWWRLHLTGLLEWLLLLIILTALVVWLTRRNMRRSRTPKLKVDEASAETVHVAPVARRHWWQYVPLFGVARKLWSHLSERRVRPFFFALICGILVVIIIFAGIGVSRFLYSANYNGYYEDTTDMWATIMSVAGIIAGVIAVLVAAFGLPILYGYPKGVKQIVKIVLYEVLFFLVIMLVAGTLTFIFHHNSPPPTDCGGPYYDVQRICPL